MIIQKRVCDDCKKVFKQFKKFVNYIKEGEE